jgi:dephospho-CoA kinase
MDEKITWKTHVRRMAQALEKIATELQLVRQQLIARDIEHDRRFERLEEVVRPAIADWVEKNVVQPDDD